MRKIVGITGIRSDYDLMSPLYRYLAQDPEVDLRLIVGGAHMSRTYGRTVDFIRSDGIEILATIESLIDGDEPSSRAKSAAVLFQSAIDAVANWSPDLLIYPGDREEVLIGALLGTYLEIPTVHFYGGDHTRTGHVDNPVRHATSKLSTAHFVSMPEHKARLVAMGEDERRIFVTGSIALDNFVSEPAVDFNSLKQRLKLAIENGHYALVIFHPDPSERAAAARILTNILDVLAEAETLACVGYPNTDPSNKELIQVIESCKMRPNVFVYRSLVRSDFLALYRNAKFIIGNSSSGITEAASIPLPAINVGIRQRGRAASSNVIFCDSDRTAIRSAISSACRPEFLDEVKVAGNPYGDGHSAQRAAALLASVDFQSLRLKTEDPLDAPYARHIDKQA